MRIFVFLPLVATLCLAGCKPSPDYELTKNKEVVKRFVEISNDAKWDQLIDVMNADFRRHSAATAGEPVRSLEEFITLQNGFLRTVRTRFRGQLTQLIRSAVPEIARRASTSALFASSQSM